MNFTPSTRRCAETRAHYAHEWYNPLRIYCPGGPDESDTQRVAREVGMGETHPWRSGCGCWTCTSERVTEAGSFSMPMCVCVDCGNKRCPKATHHDNECTASNDPGQDGSRYA